MLFEAANTAHWRTLRAVLPLSCLLSFLVCSCSDLVLITCNMKSESESCSVMSDSLWLYSPWNSPGQNTTVGSPSLLQEIFPTQGLNPALPQCRRILYQLSHKGSPWYWNTFLNKCSHVIHHFNVHFLLWFFFFFLLMIYYLLCILYSF